MPFPRIPSHSEGNQDHTEHFDSAVAAFDMRGQHVLLKLTDTNGDLDSDRLRPLSYPYSDVTIICFAIDDHASLEEVPKKVLLKARLIRG